jgi:hypothetical protein
MAENDGKAFLVGSGDGRNKVEQKLSESDAEKGLSDLLAHARSSKVNKACSILNIISLVPEEAAPRLLRLVAEKIDVVQSAEDEPLANVIPDSELVDLWRRYGRAGDAMLTSLISENLEEGIFYERLWKHLVNNSFLPDDRTRGYQLYNMLIDARIPYFQLPIDRVLMTESEYRQRLEALQAKQSIAKIRFFLSIEFTQKTEQSELLLRHINNEADNRDRAILMASLIETLRARARETSQ